MDNKATDYSSIYSIKDFYLNELGPKYFDIDEISLSNVGLLGLNIDIAASTTEDVFKTISRYLIETMPSKARLPEFIYSNAAIYGVNTLFASCSQMPVYLFIKEADILEHSVEVNGHREFTLDSDLTIMIEDIPYSIAYDIVITSNLYKGVWNHQCTYNMNFKNSAVSVRTPYIKSMKMYQYGDMYLALSLVVYQYSKERHVETILNNNRLNVPSIEIEFDGSICNFEMFYASSSTKRQDIQLLKYLETVPPTTKPFTYYKLKDEKTIKFSFANSDRYFIPEYNSDLTIYLFKTLGEKGVFEQYQGDKIFVKTSSRNPEYYYNNEISVFASVNGDSINGKNAYNLEEIRRLTIEKMLSINSYTTDNDLNVYFSNYAFVHGSEAIFVKKRDDYATREYNCYTRLKSDTDIFPTNTLDCEIRLSNVDKVFNSIDKYIINAGCKFAYLDNNLTTCRLCKNDDPDEELGEFIYTSLAVISIGKNPNTISYYINSINKSITFDYVYFNQNSLIQFIISSFNIKRNAVIGESNYTVDVVIYSTNEEASGEKIIPSNIGLILYFDTQDGHYIELSYIETLKGEIKGFRFKGEIETDDMIDNGLISITNLLPKVENPTKETKMVSMDNVPMKLLSFYNYGDLTEASHEYKSIPKFKNWTLTNIYTPIENELYLAYPLTLMKSTVKFLPDNQEQFYFYVKDIPMIKRDFLLDEENLKMTLNKIESQHTFLYDSMESITSNFTINMKFFNTFGKSKMFKLSNGKLLNKTNCTLDMSIKFNDGIIIEDYVSNIKRFIKQYIESINNTKSINQIHISELITALHNTYEQISHIIFNSLNGYESSVQSIEMVDDVTQFSSRPEFLTISEEDIKIRIIENL